MVTDLLEKVSGFLREYGWLHTISESEIQSGFSTDCKKYHAFFSVSPTFVGIEVELLNMGTIYRFDKNLLLKLIHDLNNDLKFCRLIYHESKIILKTELMSGDLNENSFSTHLSILGYYSDEIVKELYCLTDSVTSVSQTNLVYN